MCRRNLIPAMALLGFGAGLILGCCVGWRLTTVCLAAAVIGCGLWLGKRK